MNLHFKPILWLVGGIIVAFALSLVVQIYRNTQLLQRLAIENTSLIEKNEWKNAENVFLTTQNSVKNSLERGEMEKFITILQSQRNVKGLLEFSLFNPKGVVTHSSDSSFLNKTLPADVHTALASKPERFERLTTDAFEIYAPQVVTADCLRCHTSWKISDNGGTLLCRFSTDSLTQSKQSSAASMVKIKSSQITSGLVTTIVIAGFFVILAIVVVRYQIAAPLAVVLEHLTGASNQVRASSNQISSASQTLAAGASEQAASLEETSASLEELSAMTKRNAENAREAKELANHARHAAESGATDIQRMSQAMDAIKEASNNIAKIIKSIDEIAFQTNILALNAAVEAARAGEAGMGFAVVADEVRNLAQRSAQAARETAAKIEDSITKSDRGVQISLQVNKSFEEIMETVRKVDDLVVNIASASKEQSDGIGQVSIAVTEVDKVTQSNAANAEESAAAALELNAQADALKEALSKMMQLTSGAKAAAETEPESAGAPYSPPTSGRPPFRHSHKRESFQKVQPFETKGPAAAFSMPEDRRVPSRNGVIAWDEAQMSTGVESVDSQHRELIQRINELHSACLAGTANEELLKLLGFLGEYAQSHFRHEEELMQSHQCPARGQNKSAHVQFLRDYETLAEIIKRDGPSTTAVLQIKDLLGNWLKNHICSVDTKLRGCVGNGCRSRTGSGAAKPDGFRDF
jgi:hemerythrin-like metal-binding protein